MTPGAGAKRWALTLVRLAVALFILWVTLRGFGIGRVQELLIHASPGWLAVAFLVALTQIPVITWRWELVHQAITGVKLDLWALSGHVARSLLWGQFLPSTLGTDFVRATVLGTKAGIGAAARSVVCDRLVGLLSLCGLVGLTLLFPALWRVHGLPAALPGLAIAGSASLFLPLVPPAWFSRIPLIGRLAALAISDLRRVLGGGRDRKLIIALGFASHLMSLLLYQVLVGALGGGFSLVNGFLVLPAALLVSSIPISIGGWGLREATIAIGASGVGADPALAVAASILYGLSTPLTAAVVECVHLLTPESAGRRRA